MSFLRKVRADIASGENLELYITVVISLALAILGVFSVVSSQVVGAAILATLALQATSALGNRRQVAALTKVVRDRALDDASVSQFLSTDKPDLPREVRDATEILLVGITLSRTIRNLVDELDQRLKAGATVRVALIDPRSAAPAEAANRSSGPGKAGLYENRLRPSIDLLRMLAADVGPGQLEVQFLPFVPAVGLILLDASKPTGRIYIDIYPHKSTKEAAVFSLNPEHDMTWYRHFQGEFTRMWDAGRPADDADGFTK